MEIPFNGPSQEGRSTQNGIQKTVNLYPKFENPGKQNKITLYSTPGLELIGTYGNGPCRSNGVLWNNKLYIVTGNTLVSVTSDGSITLVGTISTSGSRISICSGRNYVALVDGTYGYTYNGTTFAQIADADFPAAPSHITHLDGYFIVNKGSSDEFYISAIDDPTSWDALDFATAESSRDDVLALVSSSKELYLLGDETTEVFYNSGNADFPFEPYPNGTMQIGIAAKHSVVYDETGVYWLARTKQNKLSIVRSNGIQYQPVSSDDIEWKINNLSTYDDAVAWIESYGNSTYYVITFTDAGKTYCYDISMPREVGWFEKKSNHITRWIGNGFGNVGTLSVIGDYNSGNLYSFSFDVFTENGDTIERERITQFIKDDDNYFILNKLTIDMQVGVGTQNGQGQDPQIMLKYTDNGETWSSELWETIGAVGDYDHRVEFRQLGEHKKVAFWVRVTDPVEVTIFGAYADMERCD